MNPHDQPTPRTQAVWKTHCGFSNEEEAIEAICDFRDLSNTLETELAAERERVCVLRGALGRIKNLADEYSFGGDMLTWAGDAATDALAATEGKT